MKICAAPKCDKQFQPTCDWMKYCSETCRNRALTYRYRAGRKAREAAKTPAIVPAQIAATKTAERPKPITGRRA